jgi:hypothetical protein
VSGGQSRYAQLIVACVLWAFLLTGSFALAQGRGYSASLGIMCKSVGISMQSDRSNP